MSGYAVSKLISIMQEGLLETQENAGRLILSPFAEQADVDITPKMISNLVKGKKDVHPYIRDALTKSENIAKAIEDIKTNVVPMINNNLIDDTCLKIIRAMQGDSSVPAKKIKLLQSYYDDEMYDEFFSEAIVYALLRDNLSEEQEVKDTDFYFVDEVGCKCPLTGEKLYKKGKRTIIPKYRIVQIYPDNLTSEQKAAFDEIAPPPQSYHSVVNLIALCPDCADEYMMDPTPETYQTLIRKKRQFARIQIGKDIVSNTHLEKELEGIIKEITGIAKGSEVNPLIGPVRVEEKILPEFFLLQNVIENQVMRYYPFIEERFSALDGANSNYFNAVRSEVQSAYEQYEKAGLNQEEIYLELTDWILDNFALEKKYNSAANIMVSFFVQLCEVFHPVVETTSSRPKRRG